MIRIAALALLFTAIPVQAQQVPTVQGVWADVHP